MKKLIILDSKQERFPSSNKLLAGIYNFLASAYSSLVYPFSIIPAVKKEMEEGETKVVAADFKTRRILEKHKISYKPLKDYITEKEYKKYQENAMGLVRAIPKRDSGFRKTVNYKGVSMWGMNELDIYGAFFEPIISTLEITKKIIKKEKPQSIVILNLRYPLGELQKLVAEREGLKVVDKINFMSKIKYGIFRALMPMAVKTIHSNFLRKIKYGNNKGKKSEEIVYYPGRKSCIDWGMPFLKRLSHVTILQKEDYRLKGTNNLKFEKMENYVDDKLRKNLKNFEYELKIYWNKVKRSKGFQKNVVYGGINLYPLFESMFEYLFSRGFLESAFFYEIFDNLVKKKRPKLLITMDEINKSSKTLIHCASQNNIKSLVVPHGLILDTPILGPLRASKLAVFGNYMKNALRKRGTKPEKIKVVGQPRFDDLINRKYNRKSIYAMLNIPMNKKILLFNTQPLEERYELAYEVIKAAKHFSNCQLVIKLHPTEGPRFYKKIIKKLNSNALVVGYIDMYKLYELFYSSSLVMTSFSTAALETMVLGKPVIIFNLIGKPNYIDYASTGAAIGVYKEEDLAPAINSILHDKKVQEKLEKNRKRCVYEHAYKQDGKATERVVKLIESIIKKQKK